MTKFVSVTLVVIIFVLAAQTLSILWTVSALTDTPITSTRNFFNVKTGERIENNSLPVLLSLLNSNNCPGELGIYVHGWWTDEDEAIEQTERVLLSLQKSGYRIPIIGFSWDSHTEWDIAKAIANKNGLLLTDLIEGFKDQCPSDKVRIIAHSMGARVTLSAIQSIYGNGQFDYNYKPIKSVHILGGAVDDEQISTANQNECIDFDGSMPRCSGVAISSTVDKFYSLYDPEDNLLAPQVIPTCPFCVCPLCLYFPSPYFSRESDDPLGAYPIKNAIAVPKNYEEYSVMDEIGMGDDANGDSECDLEINDVCTIVYTGDNHLGYMGYRSNLDKSSISSYDVMQLVASDWRNQQ